MQRLQPYSCQSGKPLRPRTSLNFFFFVKTTIQGKISAWKILLHSSTSPQKPIEEITIKAIQKTEQTPSALTTLCKTGCQLLRVSKSLYNQRLEHAAFWLTPSQS